MVAALDLLSWSAFYAGFAFVLVFAHFGQVPNERLPALWTSGIAIVLGLVPPAVSPGPPVGLDPLVGLFGVLELVFGLVLEAVVGALFGIIGFVTYESAAGIRSGLLE